MKSKTYKEQGFEVTCGQAGQVRRYGPTVYRYRVRDIRGDRSKDEVREFCLTVVHKADYPKKHDLRTHLTELRQHDDRIWIYTCGHDYTG